MSAITVNGVFITFIAVSDAVSFSDMVIWFGDSNFVIFTQFKSLLLVLFNSLQKLKCFSWMRGSG